MKTVDVVIIGSGSLARGIARAFSDTWGFDPDRNHRPLSSEGFPYGAYCERTRRELGHISDFLPS